MSQYLSVVVAQYGHVRLPGAKHWAIIVITDPVKFKGVAFQVTGSTTSYEVKSPERIGILDSATYLGSVRVGTVHSDYAFGTEHIALGTIIQQTPVVRDNLNWNCQNWVIAALKRLKDAHYDISELSVEELRGKFSQVQREDK